MDVWNVGEVRSMWIVSVDECCKLYYGYDVDLIGENECDKWLKELRWVEWICIEDIDLVVVIELDLRVMIEWMSNNEM